jgi:hypothetical protein
VIATVDVVRTRTRRESRALLRDIRGVDEPGRVVLGAHYTLAGRGVHAPWPAPAAGLARFLPRGDGWWSAIDLRRVFILTAWDDDVAGALEPERPWPGSVEHWHARLRPVFVTGKIGGRNPFGELRRTSGTDHEPGIVLTYADVAPRVQATFFRYALAAVDAQHGSEGALASFGTASPRRGWFRGFTVSCWRELSSALAYAYRGDVHRRAMAWFETLAPDLRRKAWFGRFAVEQSTGTLAGRDPFAGTREQSSAGISG